MQREIKFRCWDTLTNEMRYSGKHDGEFYINLKGVLYMYKIPNSDKYFKSYDVMQFTGLLDKNGKEIYEGDVFKDSIGNTIVVTWRKDLASFALRSNKWAYDHYFGEAVDAGNIEIIGNIHENPELI